MDCLHPIKIINQCKYVSLNHRDRMVLFVRCNKCAACQQYNRNVWYFRAFYEFKETIQNGGYCLFDCLTYSPKFVPKVSQYFDIPKRLDFYCFDYEHLRLFFVRLRRYLRKYNVEDNLRYFASTEYGTKLNGTHRPHIHLLFYCTSPQLDSLTLSRAVAKCWKFGRTDGLPYKSRKYVQYNTINDNLGSALRVCQYISKYVMKDSSFQKTIDKRMQSILFRLYKNWLKDNNFVEFDEWQLLPDGKQAKKNVNSRIGQFHRQSLHFGESALGDMDILQIMSDNLLVIPDQKKITMRIGLPLYYKRKLFYDLVKVDGLPTWIPNDLGKKYLSLRENDLMERLQNEYEIFERKGIVRDASKLVDYVVNYRGRIKADLPSLPLDEKLMLQKLVFCYISSSDRKNFSSSFVSFSWLGNRNEYLCSSVFDSITINEFIDKFVYFDADFEHEISLIEEEKTKNNLSKQKAFDNEQLLRQKYKEMNIL